MRTAAQAEAARRYMEKPENRQKHMERNNRRYQLTAARARKVRDWLEQGRECAMAQILFEGIA